MRTSNNKIMDIIISYMQHLRAAIIAGEQSGKPAPFDPVAFKQKMRIELKDK